jgi:hypothetical protein
MIGILASQGYQLLHIIRNSREVWRYSRSFHEQPRTCLLLHEAATQPFQSHLHVRYGGNAL